MTDAKATPPNPNRIPNPPVTVANTATDARLAPVAPSATGTPIIPAKFAPWLMLVATLGGIPAALLAAGLAIPAPVVAIGSIVGSVALVLLGGSPGIRKNVP